MTPERWKRIEELYHAAGARPPAERLAFLRAPAGTTTLRREWSRCWTQPGVGRRFLLVRRCAAGADGRRRRPRHGRHVPRRLSVQALLGAGGMGEVYRARDAKLGRDVAIKILPARFTSDPERLARFEREARVLAALNHPNIGAIYGVEEADGVRVPGSRARRGRDAGGRCSRSAAGCSRQRAGLPLARGAGDRAADRRGARGRPRQRASSIAT